MHPYPHHYHVAAAGSATGAVMCSSAGLPDLQTSAPPEFNGPEGYWSPETLLVASIADCYLLSFRAVARASRLDWERMDVQVEGVLDKVADVTRFTGYVIRPRLVLADPSRETLARTVLEKSKRVCLVTNSLQAACELVPDLVFGTAG